MKKWIGAAGTTHKSLARKKYILNRLLNILDAGSTHVFYPSTPEQSYNFSFFI